MYLYEGHWPDGHRSWRRSWTEFFRSSTVSVKFFKIEISITVSIDELPAWCMFSLATFDCGHFSSMWLEAVLWLDNSLNLTCESELWPSLVNFERALEFKVFLFVFYWKLISDGSNTQQVYICMSFKQRLLIKTEGKKKAVI